MDSDSTSRDDNPGKRFDEAANDGAINHTAVDIDDNNSLFIDDGVIDDAKMPASAAARYHGSRHDNNCDEANAPFGNVLQRSTKDSTPPTEINARGIQENQNGYYPSSARLEDTNAEEDRKMPSIQHSSATKARGRPLQRNHDIETIAFQSTTTSDNGFVPLKVIHVPNKHHYAPATTSSSTTTAAVKRAPSVPDLTSLQQYQNHNEYYNYRRRHSSRSITPPPLSDVILKIKERGGDQKQQFEERLRRAHLRLTSDTNVTRYRSKSTPSRGGGGVGETMTWGGSNNKVHNERRRPSDSNSRHGSENEQHDHDADSVHHRSERHSQAPLEEVHLQDVHRSSTDPIHITSSTNDMIAATAPLQSSSVKSSGISVAAGSHRSHGSSFDDGNNRRTIPEPPPPPPLTTERERLVERERQARLETERARRRHIALQRERELEENNDDVHHNDGVSFDDDGSDDDRNALIGQISFEEGNDGIPSPPIPPPPATEKERLVERERQARLETERARRRHLAFQREQQLEIDEQHQLDVDENGSHEYSDAMPDSRLDESPLVEALPENFGSPIAATRDNNIRSREVSTESVVSSGTGHGSGAKAVVQTNEAEATSLSYPMERFLETLGDETANAPNNVEIPPIVDNEESSLPYTMELFLAENAVGVSSDSHQAENEAPIEHHGESIILDSSNSLDLPHPPALSTDGVIDRVVSDNIAPSNFAEAVGLTTERHVNSDVSDGGPLGNNESVSLSDHHSHHPSELRVAHSPSQPLDVYTLDSPELTSLQSRPITEADIAQLAEVEHASIGNAAPQSVRDEPSETSIPRRPLLDQAFSVATQTTLVDSVTETSMGRSHLMSEANQSRDSSNIIRVGGSVETRSSGGASSASIEAVPSNVSDEESDDDSHMIINPPSTRSDTHTQSLADDSHITPDANFRMPDLTEADVVALAEIDYASIGNAPPLSVRDERLSESSVTERGGRQFSVATRISEMDSIDENSILRGSPFGSIIDEDSQSNLSIPEQDSIMSNESENTSVEVMPSDRSDNTGSHNSVEVMLSEHDNDSLHDGRMVVDIDDMASSSSIEVSPSVDLGNNLDDVNGSNLAMYGATSEADNGINYYNSHGPSLSYDHDEESSPLIPPHLAQSSHPHAGDKSARGGKNYLFTFSSMIIQT
eukprot:scaffold7287_cov138-Skeletonema_menzelii.AAC.1